MSKTPQDHQYQGTLPPGWTAVWDDNEGDYYFWNNETNETTWDNPSAVEKDSEQSKIDHHQPSESLLNAGKSQIQQYQDYVVTASFSAHTNKFKSDLSAASLPAQQINSQVTVSDIQQSLQQQSGKRRQNQGAMKTYSSKPLEVHDGRVLFIDASGKNNGLCDLAILQKAVQSGQYGPAASLIKVSDNHIMDGKIVSVYRVQSQEDESADVSPHSVSPTVTVVNKIKSSLQSDHPVKVVLNADKKRKSQFSLSKASFGPDILKQIKQTLSSDGSLKGIKFTEPSRVNDFQWLAQIQPSVKKQN
ncbi:hypothetical protein MP228_010251 [Amoeboaphelidium protococcarum]|nr:hypothetical protein MP228_010251 [Amoeboaphelidium protococcarum]